jgi:hypothetical protein
MEEVEIEGETKEEETEEDENEGEEEKVSFLLSAQANKKQKTNKVTIIFDKEEIYTREEKRNAAREKSKITTAS